MADEQKPTERNAGPWDVAMYLVQKFPAIAVAILLLAAGLYGAKLTLEEKDKAQQELQAARGEIENERGAARKEIAAAHSQAAEREKSALAKELDASKQIAQARANALLEVQNTLIETSERIQKLVLGQLNSMDSLEVLRTRTAKEMEGEIARLGTLRKQLETQLAEADRRVKLARLGHAIDNLQVEINAKSIGIDAAVQTLARSFDPKDKVELDEIDKRISESDNQSLRAALEYVSAIKTGSADRAKRLSATLASHGEALDRYWASPVFACCRDIAETAWIAMFPTVAELIANPKFDAEFRNGMLRFLNHRRFQAPPLLADSRFSNDENAWKTIAFVIELLRGRHPSVRPYPAGLLTVLGEFDLAAAHVWREQLLRDDGKLSADDQRSIRDRLTHQESDFPVLKQPPAENLVQFWTSENIVSILNDYPEVGTSASYRRR